MGGVINILAVPVLDPLVLQLLHSLGVATLAAACSGPKAALCYVSIIYFIKYCPSQAEIRLHSHSPCLFLSSHSSKNLRHISAMPLKSTVRVCFSLLVVIH